MQECINSRSEELIEYVPEALKNLLLVMASRGILTEQWLVRPLHTALLTSSVPPSVFPGISLQTIRSPDLGLGEKPPGLQYILLSH